MSAREVFAIVMLSILLGAPFVWLLSFVRHPYSSMARGRSTAAVGNILQEIDRLIARPSVEHKVETEQTTHNRDDAGGQ